MEGTALRDGMVRRTQDFGSNGLLKCRSIG
jgi:hypothetical protein